MEKYSSPFFGTEGLTSTSANHVANLAKEYYQSLETELNATSFLEESISIVGSINKTVSDKGTPEILNNCSTYIDNIVAAKALIAWLREAIKMKEQYSKELNFYVSDELRNLVYPTRPEIKTQSEILDGWNIKDREMYLTLETECAVIGNYIHPKKPFAEAKKKLFNKLVKPIETSNSGRDTMVTYYEPLVSKEMVEEKFFELQKRHRAAQAQLNGFKAQLEKEEKELQDKASREYSAALEIYKAERARLEESDKQYVATERKKIENLKIVIPSHHRKMYDYLMSR
jgi:hypothetical protein